MELEGLSGKKTKTKNISRHPPRESDPLGDSSVLGRGSSRVLLFHLLLLRLTPHLFPALHPLLFRHSADRQTETNIVLLWLVSRHRRIFLHFALSPSVRPSALTPPVNVINPFSGSPLGLRLQGQGTLALATLLLVGGPVPLLALGATVPRHLAAPADVELTQPPLDQ